MPLARRCCSLASTICCWHSIAMFAQHDLQAQRVSSPTPKRINIHNSKRALSPMDWPSIWWHVPSTNHDSLAAIYLARIAEKVGLNGFLGNQCGVGSEASFALAYRHGS